MPGWKDLPPIAKFSVIAFAIALLLGLLSMGIQGFGIYYAVGFLLPVSIDTLQGDAFWPSIILAGMAWAPSFLLAGWVCMRLRTTNRFLIWATYIFILWAWDFLLWWAILGLRIVQ